MSPAEVAEALRSVRYARASVHQGFEGDVVRHLAGLVEKLLDENVYLKEKVEFLEDERERFQQGNTRYAAAYVRMVIELDAAKSRIAELEEQVESFNEAEWSHRRSET